ncbi:phage tail protein [Enterobacter hormaechei]|uniref:phage tail fiber protein n=1 Tax=Enterobacter TaxID=547 RepID=UPI00100A04FC|nr:MULTISPECIES: phage tail protein [Enterobacter]ELX8427931.1 phage tail protein [Enterobacter hormaechei subsp. hoffmannii]EKP1097191.1 phage tail protein [Enterobacter hormaechei]EKS6522130.1 phage tail protein [Enterobacter hormaechei]EKU5014951.1 phage tail protein [Enterobacter hormaechei]EKW1078348.1 phage tail protein [Enterobacter hormaechei]
MLYNTGTIAINGNTATGTGTNWTAPASQVRAGQTIIVMSNPVQLFQISSVNSATSMTVTPAASPALSGQKYGILVSDNISVDGLAQAMSQLIKEYDENIGAWETFATTSPNQSITVTINGTPVTIPGIGKLAQKGSNGALAVADGGTGATKVEDARKNLGLGSSATKDVGTTAGNIMQVGAFGLGTINGDGPLLDAMDAFTPTCFSSHQNDGQTQLGLTANTGITSIVVNRGSRPTRIHQAYILRRTWFSYYGGSSWSYQEAYTTGNTTRASDGTLKAASPVVKVFSDGSYQTNDESDGCSVTRLGIGEYLVEGCEGLNSDAAWGGIDGGFDIPTDRNKQPLIWLDYEVNADGSVLVKTYHRTHPGAPAFARNEIQDISEAEPVDIPRDQFLSVRVEMPVDSLYNQRMIAAELAMTAEEGE